MYYVGRHQDSKRGSVSQSFDSLVIKDLISKAKAKDLSFKAKARNK